jgi:hypothetical protein
MNIRLALAAVPLIFTAGAAMAGSYTGNWPLMVTDAPNGDGKTCLTLTDNGSEGWPHSGQASIPGQPYGTFQVIGHTLVVAIEEQGGTGQNAGLVFTATAGKDKFGKGITVVIYGGESINSGEVAFGAKGGC